MASIAELRSSEFWAFARECYPDVEDAEGKPVGKLRELMENVVENAVSELLARILSCAATTDALVKEVRREQLRGSRHLYGSPLGGSSHLLPLLPLLLSLHPLTLSALHA